jgi:hypothetical protein
LFGHHHQGGAPQQFDKVKAGDDGNRGMQKVKSSATLEGKFPLEEPAQTLARSMVKQFNDLLHPFVCHCPKVHPFRKVRPRQPVRVFIRSLSPGRARFREVYLRSRIPPSFPDFPTLHR